MDLTTAANVLTIASSLIALMAAAIALNVAGTLFKRNGQDKMPNVYLEAARGLRHLGHLEGDITEQLSPGDWKQLQALGAVLGTLAVVFTNVALLLLLAGQ